MPRTSSSRRGEKRQEILEAAKRTFLRDGLQGASISAICTEAGISPGHLYHYFDSKEAIVQAISEAYLDEVQAHFSKFSESKSMISAIVSELKRAVEGSQGGGQALVFEMMAEASRNPRMAGILETSTRRTRSLLAGLIRKGQERGEIDAGVAPELAAPIIISVIDATKVMCARNADLDIAKSVRLMSTMITNLLSGGDVAKSVRKRKAD